MSQKQALAKKFDLVHQTVSPRKRVGSRDETSPEEGEEKEHMVHTICSSPSSVPGKEAIDR